MTAVLPGGLVDKFELGLAAPICLTWELTYACNLACVHCLSSSGRRDPRELTTQQCKAVIDELERMQVFYVNIGGGEPTIRSDFWELVDYANAHHVGVKSVPNARALLESMVNSSLEALSMVGHEVRRAALKEGWATSAAAGDGPEEGGGEDEADVER